MGTQAAGTVSYQRLQRELRHALAPKGVRKSAEELARESELTERDLRSEPLSAAQKAEQQLMEGRLPSLSPDDDEKEEGGGGGGGGAWRKQQKERSGADYVWNQLTSRLAPEGVAAAPSWQRQALERAHWKVDVRKAQRRKELRDSRPTPPLPPASSGQKSPRHKRKLIEKELRQLEREQQQKLSSSAPLPTPAPPTPADPACGPAATVSAAAELLHSKEEDVSPTLKRWLALSARSFDAAIKARCDKFALYEQSLQQLQLERQEIDASTTSTRASVAAIKRDAVKGADVAAAHNKEGARVERLKVELHAVQKKADEMEATTQALMHVINSLRITRVRHVGRFKGLAKKEAQMDADASFLLGAATASMEERDRLRSKHERLKHESAAWKGMQLRDAAALLEDEKRQDDERERLEGQLFRLDETAKRAEYMRGRALRLSGDKCEQRIGFLQEQLGGWSEDFQRVTDITGVSFGAGRRDAVDKVLAIYSEKEGRNASLYKYVTEDVVVEVERLEREVAAALAEEQVKPPRGRRAAAAQPPRDRRATAARPPLDRRATPTCARQALLDALPPSASPSGSRAAHSEAASPPATAASPPATGAEGEGQGAGVEESGAGADAELAEAGAAGRLEPGGYAALEEGLEAAAGRLGGVLTQLEKLGGVVELKVPRHMEGKALTAAALDEYLSLFEDGARPRGQRAPPSKPPPSHRRESAVRRP